MVENTFGILNNWSNVLLSTIQQEPELVAIITMACYVLNNILWTKYSHLALDEYMGELKLHGYEHAVTGMNLTKEVKDERDMLVQYLNHLTMPWQYGRE